jgi:glycosyltransferase involved in cell wall biosynthesis
MADAIIDAQCGWVSELSLVALAATLAEAMASPNLLLARSAAARTLGRTFSPEVIGRQLVDLYNRITVAPAVVRRPITASSCP